MAHTDPEVARVDLTEDKQAIKGLFPWNISSRTIAEGRDESATKLLFDDSQESLNRVATRGKDSGSSMVGEVVLAIEMDAHGHRQADSPVLSFAHDATARDLANKDN